MSVEEVVLKASLVNLQMQELEKTVTDARSVMREAAAKINDLNGENDVLRTENDVLRTENALLKARLRIVDLRRNRADVGHLPLRAVE